MTAGPDTIAFIVSVSDGVTTVAGTVNAPIAPAPITNAGTINIGKDADSVAVTDTRAYLADYESHTVTVVDTINRSVVTTIALDNAPVSIVVTPNGQKVYVTDDTTNQITVIAAATNTTLAPIDFGESRYPWSLAISPDGKTLYALGAMYDVDTDADVAVVTKVDTVTNKISGTVKLPAYFTEMVVSPDSTRVYVNDVADGVISVIDAKTGSVVDAFENPAVEFGEDDHFAALGGLTLNRDGTVLLAVDTATNEVVAFDTTTGEYAPLTTLATAVTTDGYWPGAVLSPDGTQWLYVADDGAVQVVSLAAADAPRAIGAPVVGIADPTTGKVAGTVTALAPGTKLTYTLISGTPSGTLVFNKATGAFTYTPTASQPCGSWPG